MKALLLTTASLALSISVMANAYVQKKQFYPSIVYITKSNPSMAVSIIISENYFKTFWILIGRTR